MNMWCLHGNLQLPAAWDIFRGNWQLTKNGIPTLVSLHCPTLWDHPAHSFEEWTQEFCRHVSSTNTGPNWLTGYSLGGRLALHAVLKQPELWQGVVVIGAHPGHASEEDRKITLAQDDGWANLFLDTTNTWDDLLQKWDDLPIFQGRPNLTYRPASAFSRLSIAACFRHFSKGRQQFLVPELARLKAPQILFLSGDQDSKYAKIGRQLAQDCPVIHHRIIPDAGHRAPWENPEAFTREIQVFLEATS